MVLARYAVLLAMAGQIAAGQGRTVEGVVTNAVTRTGIPGANLTFYTPTAVRYRVSTDTSGAFRIDQAEIGEYQAVVEKDGFIVFASEPLRVQPDESGTPFRMTFKMQLAARQDAKIAGRVLDSERKPLAAAAVDLIRSPEYRFRTFTDGEGRFMFDRLAPGAYKLRAAPSDPSSGVATYFPSSIDASAAERIIIRGAAEIDGFRLQTAPGVHVRGFAVTEDGKPAAHAILRLLPMIPQPAHVTAIVNSFFFTAPESLGPAPEEARAIAREDGTFEFPAVRAGEWRVAGNLDSAWGVAMVVVQQSDLENIQVRLEAPRTIAGTANWSIFFASGRLYFGRKAAEGVVFPIWRESLDGQPNALSLAVTQPLGAFQLVDVSPGRYRTQGLIPLIDGRLLTGTKQSRALPPESSELDLLYTAALPDGGPVLLNENNPVTLSAVTVKTAMSGSVRGTIDNASEQSGVPMVILVPAEGGSYGVLATASPDGSFEVRGLASGQYYAAAFPSLDMAGLRDPELLRRVMEAGEKISVQAGSTTERNLKFRAWSE